MRKRLWLASILILGAVAVAAWAGLRVKGRAAIAGDARSGEAGDRGQAVRYGAQAADRALGRSRDASGEVDYQLGICEMYRGHLDLARAAWNRVPPEGPFGARAALQCAMLAMSTGQLTQAEEMLQAALRRWPGTDDAGLLRGLQLLYHLEGRTEDVRRAIVASWADSDTPAEVRQATFAPGRRRPCRWR